MKKKFIIKIDAGCVGSWVGGRRGEGWLLNNVVLVLNVDYANMR